MKYLVLLISLLMFETSFAGVNTPSCPNTCVNTSGNSIYDQLCSIAAINGRAGCERYANLGCAYTEGQVVVISPGACYNAGSNSIYDQMCMAVGQGSGKMGCTRYESLGCAWNPPQYKCR